MLQKKKKKKEKCKKGKISILGLPQNKTWNSVPLIGDLIFKKKRDSLIDGLLKWCKYIDIPLTDVCSRDGYKHTSPPCILNLDDSFGRGTHWSCKMPSSYENNTHTD